MERLEMPHTEARRNCRRPCLFSPCLRVSVWKTSPTSKKRIDQN